MGGLTGAVTAQASSRPAALPVEAMCAAETARVERQYEIPAQLLDSISIVESGRYSSELKGALAWPWTVTSGGPGKYFATKAEAIAEVKRLKGEGVRNIDVGCMQINLRYHPDAFKSLEEAFEPGPNVGYAARFLKGLYSATQNWPVAASYYHSQTPHLAAGYRERLMRVWNNGGSLKAIAALVPRVAAEGGVPPAQAAEEPSASEQPQALALARPPATKAYPLSSERTPTALSAPPPDAAERAEAKAIADAYRQARLVEYRLRREKMGERRRAWGLSEDGY